MPAIRPGSHLLCEKAKNKTVKINDVGVNFPSEAFSQPFLINILGRKFLVKNSSIIGAMATNENARIKRKALFFGMNEVVPSKG